MTTEDNWARVLRAVTDGAGEPAEPGLLDEAIRLGLQVSPDSVGCSVTEMDGARFRTPVASGELAMALDQAQYDSGAGPCVSAARDRQPQQIDSMRDSEQYPHFASVAVSRDVRSSLSVPLIGTVRPAALNLYASSSSAFDNPQSHATAALLARCVSALLPAADDPGQLGTPAVLGPDLRSAQEAGAVVARAQHLLAERGRLSPEQAFLQLVQLSISERRSTEVVARDLLRAGESEFLG